jgi:four helix bundle protein
MAKGKIQSTVVVTSESQRPAYDLEERTAHYGEKVIRFCRRIKITLVTRRIIEQLVGATTSIGANYCEANEAESKRAFRVRIATCRKEAKESRHFLRMMAAAVEDAAEDARRLWREVDELTLIFATIYRNSKPED